MKVTFTIEEIAKILVVTYKYNGYDSFLAQRQAFEVLLGHDSKEIVELRKLLEEMLNK
jgi:hypothetical protein